MARRIAPMPPQQQHQGIGKIEKGVVKANRFLQNSLDQIGVETMDFPFPYGDKAYDSMDDNKTTEQLANQLMTSAVIECKDNSPSITKAISEECRIDYTNDVKRKYFQQQDLPRNDGNHNVDEGIPSKIFANDPFVQTSNQSSLSPGVYLSTNENDRMNKSQGGGYRNEAKSDRPDTPPLTLYSNGGALSARAGQYIPSHSDDNPNTQESAGTMSPGPGMPMYSVEENAQSLQAVTLTPNLNSTSDDTPRGSLSSVASSRGSMSTATNSLIKQPVLYSAIGSLEHINCNSLTNLNQRFLAPSKEFCKPGGKVAGTAQSILIPPAKQYQQRAPHTSSLLQAEMSKPEPQTFHDKDRTDAAEKSSDLPRADHENRIASVKEKSGDKKRGDKNSSIQTSLSEDDAKTRAFSTETQTIGDSASTNVDKIKSQTQSERTTNIRASQNNNHGKVKSKKKVSYVDNTKTKKSKPKTVEMFRPSSDAYTPRIERKKIKYKSAEARPSVQHMSSPMGSLQRPNFRDALRRVAMIIRQHIVKIESRFEQQGRVNKSATRKKGATDDGLFHASMGDMFNEDFYRTPTYKCNMARIPMARPGMVYGLRKIKVDYTIPSETEIYNFGHQLFKSVQLSSECSIVCLIYVERLMEVAKVPLLASTWRPIFMCGLLLASKVWQDLSSWNIEFSCVYPQFSLEAINKLELNFLRNVKWDLYISSR